MSEKHIDSVHLACIEPVRALESQGGNLVEPYVLTENQAAGLFLFFIVYPLTMLFAEFLVSRKRN